MTTQIAAIQIDANEVYTALDEIHTTLILSPHFGDENEEYTGTVDVRLRFFNGSWEVLEGDSQYDTDHRVYWASSSISDDMTEADLRELANDLIEGILDNAAM